MRWQSIVLTAAFASSTFAADWPGWRGPNRDGFAADTGLLSTWPAAGPTASWKLTNVKDIGTGYGSPVVVGDKIYIFGADGAKQDSKEFVSCLSLKDGKSIWQTPMPSTPGKYSDGWGGGPRSTPTIDGDKLYILGATGDLVCMTTDKGKVVWKKNLVKDFGGKIPNWGYSESVLIDGNHLLCTPGDVVKLDKKTGEKVWVSSGVKGGAGYSSIVIATFGGVKQYVQQNMSQGFAVKASDGKQLWSVSAIKRATAVIPTPVVYQDMVFFTAGYGAGCECYKITGAEATKLYSNNLMINHHGGVLQLNGKIYGYSDGGGQWICMDMKSGDLVWKNKGVGKGSISFADGHIYCYSEGNGQLALVKATDKEYTETSKFTIPEVSDLRPKSGKVWAHPVIANGKLLLRDYEKLFVFDIAGK